MDDVTLARALHVLAVVHWIGGLAMATLAVLPASAAEAARGSPLALFAAVEKRFSRQARWSVLLAGATGFYMTHRLDVWDRFLDPAFWWMHAMALVWAVFMALLFVAEPLLARRRAPRDDAAALRFMRRGHVALLILSAVTVGAAVLGAHGALG